MWTRPVLCRLCECPASDGGVRVDQLDIEKLSEWWRRTIGAEFEPEQGEIICQFCVCDARLENEYSVDESTSGLDEECDWWSGYDNNKFIDKFYHQDETIQRCRVDLGPEESKVQNEQLSSRNNLTDCASKKQFKCLICANVMSSARCFVYHMKKHHAGQFVLCKIDGICARVFLTEEQKMEHVQKDHNNVKKCEFCHRMYDHFHSHMSTYHKNLVRCIYYNCRTYFHSEEEMQKHIALIHAVVPHAKKCIFCSLFHLNLPQHLRKVHKSQLASAFKCPHCRSPNYFLTEAEFKNHVDNFHKNSLNCIYCNKKCIDKTSLNHHVNNNHEDVKIMCRHHGCSQYFHTKIEYECHFEQLHPGEEEKKKFQCPKCSFKCSVKAQLKRHTYGIHGTKNMPCPKCEKCFSNLIGLKAHLTSHKTKICQHCNTQIKIGNVISHQRQRMCQNCHLVLPCVQSANLHKKTCFDK